MQKLTNQSCGQGQKLMMMGTADEIVKTPEKGPVFMEDLPEEEQMVAVLSISKSSDLDHTSHMLTAATRELF
ncbi:Ubiquitin carboxyl-terminal hydrolase [Populus alba x Populus x berolinensis]|nr:Ubiquitin carboxyl-terminal hydrolase [Populus alba x Populus x berolinensis]